MYSLATTLIAALLGRAPFSRDTDENIAATLLRVIQEPPSDVREIGVPDNLARLLERAMSKEPGPRPASAGDFGRALQEVQRELGIAQTPLTIAARPASGTSGATVQTGQSPPTSTQPTNNQPGQEQVGAREATRQIPPNTVANVPGRTMVGSFGQGMPAPQPAYRPHQPAPAALSGPAGGKRRGTGTWVITGVVPLPLSRSPYGRWCN